MSSVFTDARVETVLCGASVDLPARARHSVYTVQEKQIPDVHHLSQLLLCVGRKPFRIPLRSSNFRCGPRHSWCRPRTPYQQPSGQVHATAKLSSPPQKFYFSMVLRIVHYCIYNCSRPMMIVIIFTINTGFYVHSKQQTCRRDPHLYAHILLLSLIHIYSLSFQFLRLFPKTVRYLKYS